MRLRPLLILLSCLLLSIACACVKLPSVTASSQRSSAVTPSTALTPVIVLQVTPETVAAQLTKTTDLPAAVADLAQQLALPEELIEIRIRSKDCTVCTLAEAGADSRPPPLSLTDATEALQAYDLFWLSVQSLSCAYYYDGDTIVPRGCRIEP